MKSHSGFEIVCGACSTRFAICRSCFRGQKYCSDPCRTKGYSSVRKKNQNKYERSDLGRETRRRYQTSESGKENHRRRQRVYRKRKHRRQAHLARRVSRKPPEIFRDSEHSLPSDKLILNTLQIRYSGAATVICPVCKRPVGRAID